MPKKQRKKKVIIIRSNGVNPDPRVEKEALFLSENFKVEILGWDREKKAKRFEKRNKYTIYRCQITSGYGRGIKNLIKLLVWWIYEFFWLLKKQFDIIHACDFDTYLPALLVAKIKNKKIIYDIYDFYSDMNINAPLLLKKIIRKLDLFLMKFSDMVILADDIRKFQIEGAKTKKLIFIYNAPEDYYNYFKKKFHKNQKNNNFVLGYIGLIKKERGFDFIIETMKDLPEVKLVIGGYGPYEKQLLKKIKKIKNIKFLGRIYDYKKTLEIEFLSDALFALYDPTVPNHKHSSPNKLFEAMMLAKPIIVSCNTGMDKKVEKYKCGIIINYNNKNELKEAILKLKEMKFRADDFYGKNGRRAYEEKFHPLLMKKQLIKAYRDILK